MTARTETAEALARPPARADLRRLDRVTAAALMPVGPAAVAMLRFIIPGTPMGESVAAAPDAQRAVLGLGVIVVLTLIPGAYAALHLLRRRAPRLTAWSAVFLIPGYLGMSALLAADAVAMAGYDLGMDGAQIDRLSGAIMGLPTVMILLMIFVVGPIVGTVISGRAMAAARAAPTAVGILMAVSQPLHLVAVIIGSNVLDLIAWGSTAVAMGFLASRVLRTSDAEWDLPPLSPRPGGDSAT